MASSATNCNRTLNVYLGWTLILTLPPKVLPRVERATTALHVVSGVVGFYSHTRTHAHTRAKQSCKVLWPIVG